MTGVGIYLDRQPASCPTIQGPALVSAYRQQYNVQYRSSSSKLFQNLMDLHAINSLKTRFIPLLSQTKDQGIHTSQLK